MSKGFTPIELLITTAISALLLITASSVFMIVVLSNLRANINQQLNDEGRYALEQIRFGIRNAADLAPGESCGVLSTLALLEHDGSQVRYERVVSGEAQTLHVLRKPAADAEFPLPTATTALTSNAVVVNSLNFTCNTSSTGVRSIMVSIGISKIAQETSFSDTFTTVVQMRN